MQLYFLIKTHIIHAQIYVKKERELSIKHSLKTAKRLIEIMPPSQILLFFVPAFLQTTLQTPSSFLVGLAFGRFIGHTSKI